MRPRLRKFLSYYRPYLPLLLADLFFAVIVSGAALLFPLLAGHITRLVLQPTTPQTLTEVYTIGALMVALVAVHTASNLFVDYQGHMMGTYMESDMRRDLFAHYQALSNGFYDEQKTGQLMSRITNDLFSLSELYHHGPEDLFIAVLKFTGVFFILMTISASLTLIIFLALPLMAAYALYFNRRMNAALQVSRERIGDVNAQVEDTLAGIRVVKSFTNEAIEGAKFASANQRFVESRRHGYRSEAHFTAGMTAFTQLISIAVVIFGGAAIASHTLDSADLVTYVLCVGLLIEPITRLVNFARLYQEGITGFNRFMEMLEIAPDIADLPNARALDSVQGHIEFHNVSFRYREGHNHVLNNISLSIRPGEYVALVGPSGVGKTTLCSLIPRFYEVTEGEIRIDGVNIRDVTLRSLRQQIGVVQQDVYLFAGTVADNIRYGKPDATRDEIIDAARKANAHPFIMALPHGYDTDIGQRGVKLSGGQKQRLSIARVFLKNPPVIIFDEATSALDNESERAVRESLEELTHNRTTIVIAHRLTTIQNAHRIIVLTESGIEEQGTHTSLIAREGTYAILYNNGLRV